MLPLGARRGDQTYLAGLDGIREQLPRHFWYEILGEDIALPGEEQLGGLPRAAHEAESDAIEVRKSLPGAEVVSVSHQRDVISRLPLLDAEGSPP
jgi:hypothetical protein